MSCLNLIKLMPARKAWRVFTHKVLHKLHHSKTIKKAPKCNSRPRPRKTSRKTSRWPAALGIQIQSNIFRLKLKSASAAQTRRYQSYYFQNNKPSSAVYIDQLFIQPAVSAAKEEYAQEQPNLKAAPSKQARRNKETCLPAPASSAAGEPPEFPDRREHDGNRGKGKLGDGGATNSADDMWEALVLASPQMNGINERAEEFINKFRAEMMQQEREARQL